MSRLALSVLKKNYAKIILAAIVVFALVYSLTFFIGPSNFSDDYAYTMLGYQVYSGTFVQTPYYEATTRLLTFAPIGLFYKLFGVTPLSSSAWSLTCYLITIVLVYYLGRELYSDNAGLLGAALLTIFPLINKFATSVTDDTSFMLFTTLEMLAILIAEKRDARIWYFVAGLALIAIPATGPLGGYMFVAAMLYITIEVARRKITVNKTSLYLLYGALLAGAVLMLTNYLTGANPFITITGNLFGIGHAQAIEGSNTDLYYYPSVMFPYNVYNVIIGQLEQFNLNPLSIWGKIYVINYNTVGFFYYFFIVCAAYLVIKRERSAYFLLFWFVSIFLLFEFGPAGLSLHPFQYVLANRLDRYLLVIAAPLVLTISIAFFRALKQGHTIRRYISAFFAVGGIIFLVATAIEPGLLWYEIFAASRYDVIAISNWLSPLPNYTRIYFYDGFPISLYMHYDNVSRFVSYENMDNCTSIEPNSYIIIPKYVPVGDLNYTPNPSRYCPAWQLVFNPQDNVSYPQYVTSVSSYMRAKLYYVPGANMTAYGEHRA